MFTNISNALGYQCLGVCDGKDILISCGSTPFSVSGPPVDTTTPPSTQHSNSCSQPLSTSADPKTPVGGVAGPYLGESYPNMLSNPVLAFIKAFCLKGDFDSIKRSVCEHFNRELVEGAKKALWNFCASTLDNASSQRF